MFDYIFSFICTPGGNVASNNKSVHKSHRGVYCYAVVTRSQGVYTVNGETTNGLPGLMSPLLSGTYGRSAGGGGGGTVGVGGGVGGIDVFWRWRRGGTSYGNSGLAGLVVLAGLRLERLISLS